ncbi:MAG: peptide-methionine (R)-S-oxide reductase [Bacteroidota bacterium]|jgi:peptide-methionine (R)-S-oxide reductase
MKTNIFYLFAFVLTSCQGQNTLSTNSTKAMDSTTKYNDLTPQQEQVLVNKATDRPYTGDYYGKKDNGLYICRRCNNPLYTSEDKFDSHCGWPSFDDEIKGSVTRILDADGRRTEIVCNNCQGHLGHVFLGEQMTDKNTRHCVNTSSILFVPKDKTKELPSVIK